MANRTNSNQHAHRLRHVGLVERFDATLYPFDLLFLFDRLPGLGWIVGDRIDDPDGGARVRAPVKGNVRLQIDQLNKTLGVSGRSVLETLDAYHEIRTLAFEISSLAPMVDTDYLEFRYTGEVPALGASPPQAFSRWWKQNAGAAGLTSALSEDLPGDAPIGIYGLRLAPDGLDANRPNWAELTLTPVNNTGHSDYQFDLIYRHTNPSLVEQVAQKAEAIVNKLIEQIEGRP
jgi:hypothetical protein